MLTLSYTKERAKGEMGGIGIDMYHGMVKPRKYTVGD